ncbi:hypothetical protein [Azotobacter beijerinckii]|uniref:hypothetical protein n=1 Tax=Azotobacter beijerinckii TaxID=170623 RepID=UPI0029555DDC|nr:hypothetical protein [Azotobacter beijerinckii]MDV7210149.1 hypothetical protein [Azotobacter beijerinckii]
MIYTHVAVRLTVDGKKYIGSAEFKTPTTEPRLYEHLYEAAERDLQLLKPIAWQIFPSDKDEIGGRDVLNASLERGYIKDGGEEFFPNPAKNVWVIKS